jgi:hypothetical protein
MTEDQKKALIIGGGLAAVGVLVWLTMKQTPMPGNPATDPTGYTTFNIPPPYQGSPVTIPRAVQGGCCSGNDGCFTSGQINTGNAPTGLGQLFAWYAASNPSFGSAFANQGQAFNIPPQTIMEQTSPPQIAPSNVPF